ncbi:MAG: hypothetical protein NVV73_07245 [Cellvibrionaceae bacterium]|nr:hypothetical protein [Cellvibrionaceae bacterium]
MKFLLVLLALLTCSAHAKDALSDKGILFFSTAFNWKFGNVIIDGEPAGQLKNGFFATTLEPGVHHLTGIRQHNKSTTFSIVFEIKPRTVTTLGTLSFLNDSVKLRNFYVFTKNDRATAIYLQKQHADLYKLATQPFYYPPVAFEEPETIRNYRLSKNSRGLDDLNNEHFNGTYRNDFYSDDLGILLDTRDKNNISPINTHSLERPIPVPADQNVAPRHFLNSLQELFQLTNSGLQKIDLPSTVHPRTGYQSKDLLMLEGHNADLYFSKDLGKNWTIIDTPIAEDYTETILYPTEKGLIYGPITGNNWNKYKKRLGFIIDKSNGNQTQINWSKYVLPESKFYWVGSQLLMDPVKLGNKAFLFVYNPDKDKWSEVRLPNRHCGIEVVSSNINLKCAEGDNFTSPDIGKTWAKQS